MENSYFDYSWPREGFKSDIFAHEVMNYRHHWHHDRYEINILLSGRQEFCVGKDQIVLHEDDIVLIPPGRGHGSFAQNVGTTALVLHFSSAALRPLTKKGYLLDFGLWTPSEDFRNSSFARELRYHTAKIYKAAASNKDSASHVIHGILMQMIDNIYENVPHTELKRDTEDSGKLELMKSITSYIENKYDDKITLEDLSEYTQYNRTYISTIFKETMGIGFHDYLTRVRFQHALIDLARNSDETLTDIALKNGFPDLKNFNKFFKEVLHRSPAEYREQVRNNKVVLSLEEKDRRYIPSSDLLVQSKIHQYTNVF